MFPSCELNHSTLLQLWCGQVMAIKQKLLVSIQISGDKVIEYMYENSSHLKGAGLRQVHHVPYGSYLDSLFYDNIK